MTHSHVKPPPKRGGGVVLFLFFHLSSFYFLPCPLSNLNMDLEFFYSSELERQRCGVFWSLLQVGLSQTQRYLRGFKDSK